MRIVRFGVREVDMVWRSQEVIQSDWGFLKGNEVYVKKEVKGGGMRRGEQNEYDVVYLGQLFFLNLFIFREYLIKLCFLKGKLFLNIFEFMCNVY